MRLTRRQRFATREQERCRWKAQTTGIRDSKCHRLLLLGGRSFVQLGSLQHLRRPEEKDRDIVEFLRTDASLRGLQDGSTYPDFGKNAIVLSLDINGRCEGAQRKSSSSSQLRRVRVQLTFIGFDSHENV